MTDSTKREAQRCAECDCENGGAECTWFKPGPNATSTKSENVEALAWRVWDDMKDADLCKEMSDTFRALLAERDALRKENASLRETLTAEWGDERDEFTDEIEAAHPFREPKDFRRYNLAQAMVSARHSKLELIKLVAWLLTFRAERDALREALGKMRDWRSHGVEGMLLDAVIDKAIIEICDDLGIDAPRNPRDDPPTA